MKTTTVKKPIKERDTVFKILDLKSMPSEHNTRQAYLTIVREGILAKSVNKFSVVSRLSKKLISRLIHVNERTLQRYSASQKLDLNSSERLLELARLYYFGIELFGTTERFNNWLTRENMALGTVKPIDLLEAHVGYKMVMDELMRMEHGIFS